MQGSGEFGGFKLTIFRRRRVIAAFREFSGRIGARRSTSRWFACGRLLRLPKILSPAMRVCYCGAGTAVSGLLTALREGPPLAILARFVRHVVATAF